MVLLLLLLLSAQLSAAQPLDQATFDAWFSSVVGDTVQTDQAGSVAAAYFNLDGSVLLTASAGSCYDHVTGALKPGLSPSASRVRMGSVSKLFAATLAFQLAEQGTLDLDAPLPFMDGTVLASRAPYSVRDVMCHTMPVDERALGLETRGAGTNETYEQLVARVFTGWTAAVDAPTRVSYSNMGVMYEGAAVEHAAQTPFCDVLTSQIGGLLDLPSLACHRQLHGDYDDVCYGPTAWTFEPFEVRPTSSGDLYASVSDIARFLAAHATSPSPLFANETTADVMHSILYPGESVLPGGIFNGMAHQFFAEVLNGTRVLSHSGGVYSFNCMAFYYPDHGDGLFIVTTPGSKGNRGGRIPSEAMQNFTATFHNALGTADEVSTVLPVDTTGSQDKAIACLAGPYVSTRRVHFGITAVTGIFSSFTVEVGAQGELVVHGIEPYPVTFDPVARTAEAPPSDKIVLQTRGSPVNRTMFLVATFTAPVASILSGESPCVPVQIEHISGPVTFVPMTTLTNVNAQLAFLLFELIVLFYSIIAWLLVTPIGLLVVRLRGRRGGDRSDEHEALLNVQQDSGKGTAAAVSERSKLVLDGAEAALGVLAIVAVWAIFAGVTGPQPLTLFDTNPVFVTANVTLLLHVIGILGRCLVVLVCYVWLEAAWLSKRNAVSAILLVALQTLGLVFLVSMNFIVFRFW